MKKKVFKGIAAIAILATLVANVTVVLNGKKSSHFQLATTDKVLADDVSGSGSGSGSGDMILGTPTYTQVLNQDGTYLQVVGYFNTVNGGSGYQTSTDISADVKAQNPNLSGTQLQAAVNARIAALTSGWSNSSGSISTFNIPIQSTSCPGNWGWCSPESAQNATTRAIQTIRNNVH